LQQICSEKIFPDADRRNQSPADALGSVEALRFEAGQEPAPAVPFPRRQKTEHAGVLQDAYGLLLFFPLAGASMPRGLCGWGTGACSIACQPNI